MKSSIEEIREKIANAKGLGDSHKEELIDLVDKLYSEIDGLAQTDSEHAESVSNFAKAATNEIARSGDTSKTLDYAAKGLSSSVEELEVSHPKLVDVVNRICIMLSDIGI